MSDDFPKRILHVLPNGEMGGAGRIVADLVQHQLDDPRLEPQTAVLGAGHLDGGVASDRLVEMRLPMSRLSAATRVRKFRALVNQLRPHLIHSHLWPAASCATLSAATFPGVQHLVHIHDKLPSLRGRDARTRLRKLLLRIPLSIAKPHYIAVSEACRDFTVSELDISPAAIQTIVNGIDSTKFRALSPLPDESVFTLGTAGRFAEEKGHRYLFEAVKILSDEGHQVRLLMAGDGGLKFSYQTQVAELGIADQVTFCGLVTDMDAFYRKLNAFVLPSLSEGLPLVLLEAMAAGAPVISSRYQGVQEAVTDGVTGMVVEKQSSAAIAAAVRDLIADRQGTEALRDRARESVEVHFDKQRMCRQVTEVYAEMLSLGPLEQLPCRRAPIVSAPYSVH